MNEETATAKPATKPARAIRDYFPITATIWRNERKTGWTESEGKPRIWFSVTIERHYQDSSGNWQQTNSYSNEELLVVAKLADLAHTEVSKLRAMERAAQVDMREPGAEG
jgi:hypothetical protein